MSVLYQLPDYTISWEHSAGIQTGPYGRSYGLAFVGNDATLVIDRSGWELFAEENKNKSKTVNVKIKKNSINNKLIINSLLFFKFQLAKIVNGKINVVKTKKNKLIPSTPKIK